MTRAEDLPEALDLCGRLNRLRTFLSAFVGWNGDVLLQFGSVNAVVIARRPNIMELLVDLITAEQLAIIKRLRDLNVQPPEAP